MTDQNQPKEGPGARITREGREKNLPVNDIRDQLTNLYPIEVWRKDVARSGQVPNFMPWGSKTRRKKFESTLKKDREENFLIRTKFYAENELLAPEVNWLRFIADGTHGVYAARHLGDVFVYSIGLFYIHRVPEVMVTMDGADDSCIHHLHDLANQYAQRIQKDPSSIKAGMLVSEVFPGCDPSNSVRIEEVPRSELKTKLMWAVWFSRNYQDSESFPCLHIRITNLPLNDSTSLVDSIYNRDHNIVHFKRGPTDHKPQVQPPDDETMVLGKFLQQVSIVDAADYQNLSSYKMKDESTFFKSAGVCDLETFKKIISANPDFDITSNDPHGAVHYAVFNGNMENLGHLISIGANLKGNGSDRSILMDACQNGFEDAVHVLVEGGAPLDDMDNETWTALSISAFAILHQDMQKASRIVDYLWDKGARHL